MGKKYTDGIAFAISFLKHSEIERLVLNDNTPDEILRVVATSTEHYSVTVYANIICHENSTIETLNLMAQSKNENPKIALAKDPLASLSILTLLSKDDISYIRKAVAENDITPIDLLEALAKDSEKSVRESAIKSIDLKK